MILCQFFPEVTVSAIASLFTSFMGAMNQLHNVVIYNISQGKKKSTNLIQLSHIGLGSNSPGRASLGRNSVVSTSG
jgi:hypothetical protein